MYVCMYVCVYVCVRVCMCVLMVLPGICRWLCSYVCVRSCNHNTCLAPTHRANRVSASLAPILRYRLDTRASVRRVVFVASGLSVVCVCS